ncbi:hypothetical protein LAD67_14345 [Escherichia coli]|nr:hypothetical protein [Escherichia coli]
MPSTATGVSGNTEGDRQGKTTAIPVRHNHKRPDAENFPDRWLNAVTVVPAMFVYDARRFAAVPVAAHSASEYRQPATTPAGVTIRHCIPG